MNGKETRDVSKVISGNFALNCNLLEAGGVDKHSHKFLHFVYNDIYLEVNNNSVHVAGNDISKVQKVGVKPETVRTGLSRAEGVPPLPSCLPG